MCVCVEQRERRTLAEPDNFLYPILTPPQGRLRLGPLRLESTSTTAQPISALSISVFFYQVCVPQSSAVIKQLKGSVNWDDGIEREMNFCVSVRVGEYFWGCVWKKTPRQIGRQRQMRLSGHECLCLHLEIVLRTSDTPHRSFPLEPHQHQEKFPAQVLCQGELQNEGESTRKVLEHIPSRIVSISHCQMN